MRYDLPMTFQQPPLKDIRALASDLDGTLLGSDGQIPKRNASAIAFAQSQGITTFAATARSPRSTTRIARSANLESLAVCANGAIGYLTKEDKYLWHDTLNVSDITSIIKMARDAFPNTYFALEYGTEFFYEEGFFPDTVFINDVTTVPDILQVEQSRATKLVCRSNGVTQNRIKEVILNSAELEIAISYGSTDWVEILPPGVSKGTGVLKACDYLGIEASSLACVGDHLNDLPMFDVSGISAAVANAHPSTLEKATWTVASNDECGVAEVLARVSGVKR